MSPPTTVEKSAVRTVVESTNGKNALPPPPKKYPNCAGKHSASDKICPRFAKESVVLKIKHTQNLTYAEACKQHSKMQVSASIPGFKIKMCLYKWSIVQ